MRERQGLRPQVLEPRCPDQIGLWREDGPSAVEERHRHRSREEVYSCGQGTLVPGGITRGKFIYGEIPGVEVYVRIDSTFPNPEVVYFHRLRTESVLVSPPSLLHFPTEGLGTGRRRDLHGSLRVISVPRHPGRVIVRKVGVGETTGTSR